MTELIPPDREQCQALRPNKTWSPMASGPVRVNPRTGEKRSGSVRAARHWRCRERPVVIVTETKSEDGLLGSMSLCKDCFIQLCLQQGGTFEVTQDVREPETN